MTAGAEYLVWTKTARHSLEWIQAFLLGTAGVPLRREAYLRELKFEGRYKVAVDASPWGLGGILMDGVRVKAHFHDAVSEEDCHFPGVEIGSPKGQAALEALAILVALRVFAAFAAWKGGARIQTAARGDSKAALGMALKVASPNPALNAGGRELAYDLASRDYALELLEHTPGVMNRTPDWLSRLAGPADKGPMPEALLGSKALVCPRRDADWWRTLRTPRGTRLDTARG